MPIKDTKYISAYASDSCLWTKRTQSKRNSVILKILSIRLSDGINFYDAILLGPYDIINNKIVVSPFTAYHSTTMEFKKFDIIKLIDYFNKIDHSKICRLKMMIRKIIEVKMY